MHFMLHFTVILAVFAIVKCTRELVGKNDRAQSGNEGQDEDGNLNLINGKSEINKGLPSSWNLRKNKCGKTKKTCKDVEGYCLSKGKEDECDGEMLNGKKYCSKNKKCGCCVPEEKTTCTRDSEGSCVVDYSFHRRFAANGKPCVTVIANDGTTTTVIPNECYYNGLEEEGCFYIDSFTNTLIYEFCGGDCDIPTKFRDDHMCSWCNNEENGKNFTINRNNSGQITRNHVFRSVFFMGKIDWALNVNVGVIQPICRIPFYVQAWYCEQTNDWQCCDIGYSTGGGIAYGVVGHTAGHFLPASLYHLV